MSKRGYQSRESQHTNNHFTAQAPQNTNNHVAITITQATPLLPQPLTTILQPSHFQGSNQFLSRSQQPARIGALYRLRFHKYRFGYEEKGNITTLNAFRQTEEDPKGTPEEVIEKLYRAIKSSSSSVEKKEENVGIHKEVSITFHRDQLSRSALTVKIQQLFQIHPTFQKVGDLEKPNATITG